VTAAPPTCTTVAVTEPVPVTEAVPDAAPEAAAVTEPVPVTVAVPGTTDQTAPRSEPAPAPVGGAGDDCVAAAVSVPAPVTVAVEPCVAAAVVVPAPVTVAVPEVTPTGAARISTATMAWLFAAVFENPMTVAPGVVVAAVARNDAELVADAGVGDGLPRRGDAVERSARRSRSSRPARRGQRIDGGGGDR
jgi:hypothetical protein